MRREGTHRAPPPLSHPCPMQPHNIPSRSTAHIERFFFFFVLFWFFDLIDWSGGGGAFP